MLTERTYDSDSAESVVTICIFIEQILIDILFEILISAAMAFIAIYTIKVAV